MTPVWIVAVACISLLLWTPNCNCQSPSAGGALIKSIPVQLAIPGSKDIVVRYVKVDIYADDVGSVAQKFCEEYEVASHDCPALHDHVTEFIQHQRAHVLKNPHLVRHQAAADAELGRTFTPELFTNFSSITTSEERVVSLLKNKWTGHKMRRVSFLHSCQVTDSNDTRILERMLNQVSESGLLNSLDTLVVLNYGSVISQAVKDRFSFKIEWIQVHPEIIYFEIPTLRIMHHMVAHLTVIQPETEVQVLYLHTKGTSYAGVVPQIQDWTDLMMHFLVERHEPCLHLLQSGVIDAVGALYRKTSSYRTAQDYFPGNFWWATGSYLASRPILRYEHSIKYDAEYWLLRYSLARIFILHYSNVDHYTVPYPRPCYAAGSSGRVNEVCGGALDVTSPKYIELQ